jgi:hypothetical protein
VTDFTAFFQGNGSVQTFLTDIGTLLGQGATGQATLIADLEKAAFAAAPGAAAGTGATQGASSQADTSSHSFDHFWHHG